MTIAVVENNSLVVTVGSYAASITAASIISSFDALSHFPERRAALELSDLAIRINRFGDFVDQLAAQESVDVGFNVMEEKQAFAMQHVAITRAFWAAESRCMSWFVTGAANFPVARNEKRQRSADARSAEIREHDRKARKAAKRRAFPYGAEGEAIRSNDPEALEKIRKKIAGLENDCEQAKTANRIIRTMRTRKAEMAEIVRAVVEQTDIEAHVIGRALQQAETFRSPLKFDTTLDRAEIRRLQDRLASLERLQERGDVETTVETSLGEIEIIENTDAARIQLVFPGKPDDETRRLLKSNGFRWSPTHGAWQRHLNENGRWAAQRVVKQLQDGAGGA
ncbi:hypothetical protein [Shinella sp. HZN7]|uniref:hypothetical protein n=1 Tax=Shinella sp. (strain HZN7) TaxID=879274 RepID=UPI0007DA6B7F|nr:hypothetical protein [Shinella sp. HZN7]ANH08573.1 hypothetical protein shn_30975 [Shinella sp. HZN7]